MSRQKFVFNTVSIHGQVSQLNTKEFCLIIGCIISALFLRMLTAFLVGLANNLSIKESVFVSVTWIPKAIVEVNSVPIIAYINYIPRKLFGITEMIISKSKWSFGLSKVLKRVNLKKIASIKTEEIFFTRLHIHALIINQSGAAMYVSATCQSRVVSACDTKRPSVLPALLINLKLIS